MKTNPQKSPNSPGDTGGEQYWEVAARYTNSIGRIASNFSSAVRAITLAELKFGNQRSPEARKTCQKYVLPWLKRSPSLKAVFYYAAESMYEEDLEKCESLTLSKLLDIFYPGEVATIMGLIYLKRRLEKKCDATEWERISTLFQTQMELGSLVGEKIAFIGSGTGMLIGGLRVLGYSVLAIHKLDEFKKYRRSTNQKGELFDLDYEIQQWGCNHLHIASLLVSNMGFGLSAGLGMGLGMASKTVDSPEEWFLTLDEETQCWQVALSWVEALHASQPLPDFIPEDHPLFLSKKKKDDLQKAAMSILAKGSTFNWTERRKDDLTEELQIRLGLIFDNQEKEEENLIFEEIEKSEDFVELSSS